jgi:hypothetical protein
LGRTVVAGACSAIKSFIESPGAMLAPIPPPLAPGQLC